MCYTEKQWHRCGVHTRRKPVYCARAGTNPATGRQISCGNPGGTVDSRYTYTFCSDSNCPFIRLGGIYTCCQYHKAKTVVGLYDCGHIYCNNCTP